MTMLRLPFGPEAFPARLRQAAGRLWGFHLALHTGGNADEDLLAHARGTCEDFELGSALVDAQVTAAARLASPVRFETARELAEFCGEFVGSHGLLLGRLAGQVGSWQERPVRELATAVFLLSRLFRIREDIWRDRLYIPESDLSQAGISLADIRFGRSDEAMRRLVWKQTILVRNAFAHARELGGDLSGWKRREFRRSWLGGLYLLSSIERSKYDVWSAAMELSRLRRTQLWLHVHLGKTR